MPSTRQYGQVTSLDPTDAFVLDRIGTGTVYIEAENFIPSTGYFPDVASFGYVDPTGVNDSSPGFLAAIASGQSFFIPPGTYLINSPLVLTRNANTGQIIQGAGSTGQDSQAAAQAPTILKPGASANPFITIEGTDASHYANSISIRDLSINMANLADTSTSIGILQQYAFDISYSNVRVKGFGNVKRSWQFLKGAFTSSLTNCQGSILEVIGDAITNPTTLSFFNCDFYAVNAYDCASLNFYGGAVQTPYPSILGGVIYLPSGTTPVNYTPANTTGLYAAVMSKFDSMQNIGSFNCDWELAGTYPATYNDGVHGVKTLVPVIQVTSSVTNARWVLPVMASQFFLDGGNSSVYEGLGSSGTIHNDTVVFNRPMLLNEGQALYGFSDNDVTRTILIDSSTGIAQFQGLNVRPLADGTNFTTFFNAEGAGIFGFHAEATARTSSIFLEGGAQFEAFNDVGGSVQTINIDGYTGSFSFNNVTAVPVLTLTTNGTAANSTLAMVGAFSAKTVNVLSGGAYGVNSVQVVGARVTGWGAGSGTASKVAYASYAGQTYGVTYVQAAAQATDDAVKLLSQTVVGLIQALTAHGLIGP